MKAIAYTVILTAILTLTVHVLSANVAHTVSEGLADRANAYNEALDY